MITIFVTLYAYFFLQQSGEYVSAPTSPPLLLMHASSLNKQSFVSDHLEQSTCFRLYLIGWESVFYNDPTVRFMVSQPKYIAISSLFLPLKILFSTYLPAYISLECHRPARIFFCLWVSHFLQSIMVLLPSNNCQFLTVVNRTARSYRRLDLHCFC